MSPEEILDKFLLVPENNRRNNVELYNKCHSVIKEQFHSFSVPVERKFELWKKMYLIFQDEAIELYQSIKDTFISGYYSTQERSNHIQCLLRRIVLEIDIPAIDKLIFANSIKMCGYFSLCYKILKVIANDASTEFRWRVEAALMMYLSDDLRLKEESLKCMLDIVSVPENKLRHDHIWRFIPKSDNTIRLIVNSIPVKFSEDEDFIIQLQKQYIDTSPVEEIRNVLLSVQYILEKSADKDWACGFLIGICHDQTHDENCRADAADILLRLGTKDSKEIALEVLKDLGRDKAVVDTKTVYNDKQNIHTFNQQLMSFIETDLVEDTSLQLSTFTDVKKEVESLVKTLTDRKQRLKAYAALERISKDTAIFTEYCVTSAELLVRVWAKIHSYTQSEIKELKIRIIDELSDMGNTCSTGHAGRLVNIFNGYGLDLKIEYRDQVKANMSGRLKAKIETLDDDIKMAVCDAQTPELATEEDLEVYKTFLDEYLPDLRNELYTEFVEGGYISSEEFWEYFSEGTSELTIM